MDKFIKPISDVYKKDGTRSILKISDIIIGLGLTPSPDASAIYEASKVGLDKVRDYIQKRNTERIIEFHREMLYKNDALDQEILESELSAADFHALLDACVSDIEEEKTTPYASLTRSIALGLVPLNYRRHFIHSMKEVAFEHLDILRAAYTMTKYSCISQDGKLASTHSYFPKLQADSITRLSLNALLERGLISEAALTPLGVCFIEACYSPEDLSPENFDYKSSRIERGVVISSAVNSTSKAIEEQLIKELRSRQIQVEPSSLVRYDGSTPDEPYIKFASYAFVLTPYAQEFSQLAKDTLNNALCGKKSIQIIFDGSHDLKGGYNNTINIPSINARNMSAAQAATEAVDFILNK
jgi:hypothetical protein